MNDVVWNPVDEEIALPDNLDELYTLDLPERGKEPALWHGMTMRAWLSMLREHEFAISRKRLGLVLSVSAVSLFNSLFAALTRLKYDRKLDQVDIEQDPVLIIGFQRSGTTFLNELMGCDPRLAYPSNLHCFTPEHHLLTGNKLRERLLKAEVKTRPMDNVEVHPDAPQEDEIALLLMGVHSPYSVIAFPDHFARFRSKLENEYFDETRRKAWDRAWSKFLRAVQYLNPGKRLLLKSPTHTVQIQRILDHFPNAKFIHITRDPYKIFNSNLKLGPALTSQFGLQETALSPARFVRELVNGFRIFHEAFSRQEVLIPEGNLVRVAYEDLVKAPEDEMRRIYETLNLGDFDPIEEPLRAYLDSRAAYKTNPFVMPSELVDVINTHWASYFEDYGYQMRPASEDTKDCAQAMDMEDFVTARISAT